MVNVAEYAFDSVFPTTEELWERNGANIVNGVPHFDNLEIDGDPTEYSVRNLYAKDGFRRRKIGSAILLGYTMNDGVDRLVSVRTLDDSYRSDADMIATTSTALTTTVGGYAGRRDDRIAREVGLQTVTIGAEGSTNERLLSSAELGTITLAKTAQSEQAILADVSQRFDLPTKHYGMGDSRGAMIKPAHSLYASDYGNEVVFTDIKAPCIPDRLTYDDVPKVALWAGVEVIGGIAVAASLFAERDLGLLLGTFDPHPRAMSAVARGIIPALASGEAGRLTEMTPDDIRGHVVLYGLDILSSVHRWHEIYSHKFDMVLKNVPRGSHAHLLSRISLQIDRIKRAEASLVIDGELDTQYIVRGHKPDYKKQADLRLVANS